MAIPYVLAPPRATPKPFPHVVVRPVLDDRSCRDLFTWLRDDAPWQYHQGSFFRQMECDLLQIEPSAACASLFTPEAIASLRHAMEGAFGVELDSMLTVIAHKLLPGFRIGLHNDAPDMGMETHRLVLQLNPPEERPEGGDLVLYRDNTTEAVHARYAPDYNLGVGFELSDRSFHAVTPIERGARYTVIYSFWTPESAEAARRQRPSEQEAALGALLQILGSLGANQVEHSGRTLLHHLLGTYEILHRWGCSQAVCIAGLFHSVYGTEGFSTSLLSESDRPLLQQLLPSDSEELAFLFGATSRGSLYDALRSDGAPRLRLAHSNDWVDVERERLIDLLVMDAANFCEQAARAAEPIEEDDYSAMAYRELAPLLPVRARSALAHMGIL